MNIRKTYGDRGVTLLEFILIAPVVVLFIIGIMDVARYLMVGSVLEKGAILGATEASRKHELTFPSISPEFQAAKLDTITKAKEVPLNSFLTDGVGSSMAYLTQAPRLILPQPKPGESRKQAFKSRPITVSLDAEVVPFLNVFGVPTFPVTRTAVAYLEPDVSSSYPVSLNCLGEPLDGRPPPDVCPCPNPTHMFWDKSIRECRCLRQLTLRDGECHCPNGGTLDDSRPGLCICPLTAADCPLQGQYVSTNTCVCNCPTHSITENGACFCPPDRVREGVHCVCPPPAAGCSYGMLWDRTACACRCPKVCPNGKHRWGYQGHTDCSCDCSTQVCSDGLVGIPGQPGSSYACECGCPPDAVRVGNDCVCPNNKTLVGNQCLCNDTSSCLSGLTRDPNTCLCSCDPNDPTCSCPASTIQCGGGCVSPCPSGQQLLPDCSCGCPAGTVWLNGICIPSSCTGPGCVWDGVQCSGCSGE